MKNIPPSKERVLSIVEMMEECGLYTHGREVKLLGEQRDRCEDALRSINRLLTSDSFQKRRRSGYDSMVHLLDAITITANEALAAGIDEEFEYIQRIARELRAGGKTDKASIEERLKQDGKL